MNKQLIKDTFGWGIGLWLIGYTLGIVFFMFVPHSIIGWIIAPIGATITLLVLSKKVKSNSLQDYLKLAVGWIIIAILFDYLFLVKMLKPEDGYYKLDVYLYYFLTLILPLLVGWRKNTSKRIIHRVENQEKSNLH